MSFIKNIYVRFFLLAFASSVVVNSFVVITEWRIASFDTSRSIIFAVWLFMSLLAFLVLLCCFVTVVYSICKRRWQNAVLAVLFCATYWAVLTLASYAGMEVRISRFEKLTSQFAPVIDAINKFSLERGRLPENLDEFPTDIRQQIPQSTGAYASYEYITGKDAQKCYSSPWAVKIDTGTPLSFDYLLYLPNGNYKDHDNLGGVLYRCIGCWAYYLN